MESTMSKDSFHRILTENLGLRKVCAQFIPHKLTNDQKLIRIKSTLTRYYPSEIQAR